MLRLENNLRHYLAGGDSWVGVVMLEGGAVVWVEVGQAVGPLHEAVGLEHGARHLRVAQHAVDVVTEKLPTCCQGGAAQEEGACEPGHWGII